MTNQELNSTKSGIEKPCDLCKEQPRHLRDDQQEGLYELQGNKLVFTQISTATLTVKYCPMCGRRLA